MMRQLRESTKIIMIVVALAFVALMVFDWAMDLTGRSAGRSNTVIGKVNGRDIPLQEYERQYENALERLRSQDPDGSVNDEQVRQAQQMAWDNALNLMLLQEETRRRGIQVDDEEVAQYVRSTPPTELQTSPALQTDGKFDPAKWERTLADPQFAPTLAAYQANVRQELPLRKLQAQVVSGVAVGDHELEEAYRAAQEQARVRYLYLDPEKLVPDSAVSVTDAELRKAYDTKKDAQFARKAAARIGAVQWKAQTSAADTARVRAEIDSLRARIVAGEDFGELARTESQDPGSAGRGGDLGFFGRGQMVPEFEQAAYTTPKDSVSQPFLTPFGWHILKAGERQKGESGLAGDERVRVQHILRRIEPSEETFAALEDSAAALQAPALAKPDSFQQVMADHGLTVQRPPPFEQSAFIPGLGRVPEVTDWVFDSPAGSVSDPIRSGNAVYLVHVDERIPAGYVPFEEVAEPLRKQVLFEKKLAQTKALESRATGLVEERGLDGAASELGLDVKEVGPFARSAQLPQIGGGNAFVGTTFGLQAGQTAGPIELENGVYYLTVAERKPADMDALAKQKEAFRQQLMQKKTQQTVDEWFRALKKEAKVEDFRDRFLEVAEADSSPASTKAPPLF
jgi:peptidyl-prolyl cis-trans isomerase D